jgi:hypothetical protein
MRPPIAVRVLSDLLAFAERLAAANSRDHLIKTKTPRAHERGACTRPEIFSYGLLRN